MTDNKSKEWIRDLGLNLIKNIEVHIPVTTYYCKLCYRYIGHYEPKTYNCKEYTLLFQIDNINTCESTEYIAQTKKEMVESVSSSWSKIWNELETEKSSK